VLKNPSSDRFFSQSNTVKTSSARANGDHSRRSARPNAQKAPRVHQPAYPIRPPEIVSRTANTRFRQLCQREGRDPDNPWVGDYVTYEWQHGRPLFADIFSAKRSPRVLEFGCNIGATAIVLARQGAQVTAIDVSPGLVDIAVSNVERYGLQDRVDLLCLQDSAKIPAASGFFDHIVCNSVLEYVAPDALPAVQRELARLLKPGGSIHILGTSNRLWPWEIHSRAWFSNYVPQVFDRWLGQRTRGLFPWQLTAGFPGLVNADLADDAARYIQAKQEAGSAPAKLSILKLLAAAGRPFAVSPGLLTSSIVVKMRKASADG
jgi:2-polyprenyl-3-methyl-5-hydroxy-6-metoxy-1,4-benzoquinol methylase